MNMSTKESHYLRGDSKNEYHPIWGKSFKAIFRPNEGLSAHGTTPVEFVMLKSSFPQKFGQGFAPWSFFEKAEIKS